VLDLRKWVKYAEGGNMGWGVYKMYYMLRLPKTAEREIDYCCLLRVAEVNGLG
jgi:hypothetical protein